MLNPGEKACPVITGPTTKVLWKLFDWCNWRDDDDDGDDDDVDDDGGDEDFNSLWGIVISLVTSLVKRCVDVDGDGDDCACASCDGGGGCGM